MRIALRLVLGAAVVLAAVPVGCPFAQTPAGERPPEERSSLEERLQALREHGNYAQAVALAERIATLVQADPAARPYERADARARVEGLRSIAALTAAAQQELAQADRATAQLDAGFAAGNYADVSDGARRQLETRRRHLGEAHPDLAQSLGYLGVALQSAGDHAGADQCYRDLLVVLHALHGDEHPDVATTLNNLASLAQERGDWLTAEALYRTALAMRRSLLGPGNPEVAGSLNNLATLLQQQGDFAEAEPLLREALGIARQVDGEGSMAAALALSNLADVLQSRAELESDRSTALLTEAEQSCRRSLELHRQLLGKAHPDVAAAQFDLAGVLVAQGKLDGAEPLLREALAARRKLLGAGHPDVARTLAALGALERRRGQVPAAIDLITQALALDRAAYGNQHWRVVEDLTALGALHLQRGEPALARPLLTQACDAYEAARLRVGSGSKQATARIVSPYALLASTQLALGEHEAAWASVEKGQGRLLSQLLQVAGARSLTATEAAREDSLQHLLTQLESQVAALQHGAQPAEGAPGTPGIAQDARLERVRQQLLEAEAAWSALQLSIAGHTQGGTTGAAALARVQAALRDGEALLGWLELDASALSVGTQPAAWGYVVRHQGGVRWVRLEAATAGAASAALRGELSAGGAAALGVTLTARLLQLAGVLYQQCVEPLLLAAQDQGSLHELVVIPSGVMLGVPVEALVESEGSFLVDRFAVSYVPSAAVLTLQRERHAQQALRRDTTAAVASGGRRALIVGDPVGGDVQRLDWSAREAAGVERSLGAATRLEGRDASESRLAGLAASGELARYDVLHFATHAVVDDASPERSALLLSQVDLSDPYQAIVARRPYYDGRLTAREIVQTWKLDTDLVALSACETGLGRRTSGEGYLGLAHALFQVGARSLLVSLWKVDDEATASLMQRFYDAWRGGGARRAPTGKVAATAKVEALRQAKRALRDFRDASGAQPFAHPYYWAGFVLIGEGD